VASLPLNRPHFLKVQLPVSITTQGTRLVAFKSLGDTLKLYPSHSAHTHTKACQSLFSTTCGNRLEKGIEHSKCSPALSKQEEPGLCKLTCGIVIFRPWCSVSLSRGDRECIPEENTYSHQLPQERGGCSIGQRKVLFVLSWHNSV
jgi:hypothetical protein